MNIYEIEKQLEKLSFSGYGCISDITIKNGVLIVTYPLTSDYITVDSVVGKKIQDTLNAILEDLQILYVSSTFTFQTGKFYFKVYKTVSNE